MAVEDSRSFNSWVDGLGAITDRDITSYDQFLEAIRTCATTFFTRWAAGSPTTVSKNPTAEDYTEAEIAEIFRKARLDESR